MYENYNHNVTVNATEILCNNDKSVGIYDLQFVGSSAKSALEVFVNDLSNSSNGINLTICRLRLCQENRKKPNTSNENGVTDKSKTNEQDSTFIILLIMVIILAIVSILHCFVVCCLRYSYICTCIHLLKNNVVCTQVILCINNYILHVCMYYILSTYMFKVGLVQQIASR